MIPLNKPFLPYKKSYIRYIDEIWHRNHLTNHGPLVKQFEDQVSEYLGTDKKMVFVNNGTTALQIAIKALDITGEIITTPYSYVATTNAILWTNCKPVFTDIEESSLNIDPIQIESAITNKTQAILATHVYGNPCNVEIIQELAVKYGLKVIYDAAHCFGVKYKEESLFKWGGHHHYEFSCNKDISHN